MLSRITSALWGKFEDREEFQKFILLGVIFCLIIATYWGLRPMKDSIFNAIVGAKKWLWLAKIISLLVIPPLVILYGKLIDTYPRHRVFYALIAVYGVLALLFSWAFLHPTMGLANTTQSHTRLIGWAWYVFVESFGSLIVALFWAFTADTTKPESAKRGFPIIALLGQVGNILGPSVLNTKFLGFKNSGPIVAICAGLMFLTGFVFWLFMRVTPKNQLIGFQAEGKEEKHTEPGFFEGLKLLVTKGYLFGMFMIITLYELIVTYFDFHFKQTVFEVYPDEATSQAFLAKYGTYVGIVATACILLGINKIQSRLGMRASLITLPIMVAIAVLTVYFNPTALNIIMWIVVLLKAVNYALNQPTMKQLYIPTTDDTKYKAQAWIEMFGSRGSKAAASVWNSYRSVWGINPFITITSFLSLGLIGSWVLIALYVAKTYNAAIREKRVVC